MTISKIITLCYLVTTKLTTCFFIPSSNNNPIGATISTANMKLLKLNMVNANAAEDSSNTSAPSSSTTRQSQYGTTIEAPKTYVRCGSCGSIFYLTLDDLTSARGGRVQCTTCQHSWFQAADRLLTMKDGFELQPLTEQDTQRIETNIKEGRPANFVGDGKLYVGNLDFKVTENDLEETFSKFGTVGESVVVLGEDGRSRGFAFVTMYSISEGEKAMKGLDGEELLGRQMQVRLSNN